MDSLFGNMKIADHQRKVVIHLLVFIKHMLRLILCKWLISKF